MGSTPYDIAEHRHRFGVWAAARAVRGAKTDKVRAAFESSGMRKFVKTYSNMPIDEATFELHHREICLKIAKSIGGAFGRAAKLVNIYLKAVAVIGPGDGQDNLSIVAHPPIDSFLLKEIARRFKINIRTTWMNLPEEDYYNLIVLLRTLLPNTQPFWMLEEYWTLTKDGDQQ